MTHNEFSPSHYTDLTFEAESGSIHSAPNHILFQYFFQRILFVNYLINPSRVHKSEVLQKSQVIHNLGQIKVRSV